MPKTGVMGVPSDEPLPDNLPESDPMTSAERPTQEVAPRTEAGRALLESEKFRGEDTDWTIELRDAIAAIEDEAGTLSGEHRHPEQTAWTRAFCPNCHAALAPLVYAEASRSEPQDSGIYPDSGGTAPPAAVTAEQLAELRRIRNWLDGSPMRYLGATREEYVEDFDAILSKITPAGGEAFRESGHTLTGEPASRPASAQPSASSEGDGLRERLTSAYPGVGAIGSIPKIRPLFDPPLHTRGDDPLLSEWERIASGELSLSDATGTNDVAEGVRLLGQWALRDLAAKPTGSADEPLLRAALERLVVYVEATSRSGLLPDAVKEARAALASAEPAEPQP